MDSKENPAEPSLSDVVKLLQNMDKTLNSKVDSVKSDLEKSISDQATNIEQTLKRSIDEAILPISKRQDEFENKSDERFKELDIKNNERFKKLEETMASLCDSRDGKNIPRNREPTPTPPMSFPPPAQSYQAVLSSLPRAPCPASDTPTEHSAAIADLITDARRVIGIGPIYQSHLEQFGQIEQDQAIRLAAIEALRYELNIKENEVADNDIENTFLPARAPKFPRVYIRFYKQEHADLCLRIAKTLKNRDTKVFRYFPRQFQARVRALEEVAYPMRKETSPGYKTEVVFTTNDVQLLVCPRGLTRYQPHHVPDLPPIDMTPFRSPPPGRPSHKRIRSDTPSPEISAKSSRLKSPEIDQHPDHVKDHVDANLDKAPAPLPLLPTHGEIGQHPTDVQEHADINLDSVPPPIPTLPDLGGYSSMEVFSPRTGKAFFNLNEPVNLRRQTGNF